MKNLLVLLFTVVTFCVYSQKDRGSWKYYEGGSVFDGEVFFAYAEASKSTQQYRKPLLVISTSKEYPELDVRIADLGHICSDVRIAYAFDEDPNTLIVTKNSGVYVVDSKESLYVSRFQDLEEASVTIPQFIRKLISYSKVDIRIQDACGSNDYTFNLKGSTEAIRKLASKREEFLK